jgi:2-isopropylmalate synthase
MSSITLYDTTLRDGAQREGISFSVVDKINIVHKLDELGIRFVEGGWPGSNPKDTEFFRRARKLSLSNSRLVAFGSTRRPKVKAENDSSLQTLLQAGTQNVTIVGKSSEQQVIRVLEATLDENLGMIADSIAYLKANGLTVFFDAEHFFDGFRENPEYSIKSLEIASSAGADYLVLCDTNGGVLPDEIATSIEAVMKINTKVPIGIHAHNDSGLAVANTVLAVQAGATLVQGTINGYGERCGNVNLCSIIPILKLKMDSDCISDVQLSKLTEVSHYVSEVANLIPDPTLPFVGISAFSHKGGLHVAAMSKWNRSYQHIDPVKVGNIPKVVVSELSGRKSIIKKAAELGFDLEQDKEKVGTLVEKVKLLESNGFQYEGAEASLELLVHRSYPDYRPLFELIDFLVVVERHRRPTRQKGLEVTLAEAMVKVKVAGETIHTAAEGNGPVNALDSALRKALLQYYPELARVKLVDYKVRLLEERVGTESKVRVLIESTDGNDDWQTVGSSTDIIEASWLALADSLEYWLSKRKKA